MKPGRWNEADGETIRWIVSPTNGHDQLATGRKIRVLTVADTFSRFSPAIVPRFSFRAPDVIEVLERVGRETDLPKTLRVDQGSEFISRDLDLWAYQRDVTLDFSRRASPRTTPSSRA